MDVIQVFKICFCHQANVVAIKIIGNPKVRYRVSTVGKAVPPTPIYFYPRVHPAQCILALSYCRIMPSLLSITRYFSIQDWFTINIFFLSFITLKRIIPRILYQKHRSTFLGCRPDFLVFRGDLFGERHCPLRFGLDKTNFSFQDSSDKKKQFCMVPLNCTLHLMDCLVLFLFGKTMGDPNTCSYFSNLVQMFLDVDKAWSGVSHRSSIVWHGFASTSALSMLSKIVGLQRHLNVENHLWHLRKFNALLVKHAGYAFLVFEWPFHLKLQKKFSI